MGIEGSIGPMGGDPAFTREAWCRLIDRRGNLRPSEPRRGINPFNGELMIIPLRPDFAEVVADGISVERAWWTMGEDEPEIRLAIERSAIPLAEVLAVELGGELRWRPTPGIAD